MSSASFLAVNPTLVRDRSPSHHQIIGEHPSKQAQIADDVRLDPSQLRGMCDFVNLSTPSLTHTSNRTYVRVLR